MPMPKEASCLGALQLAGRIAFPRITDKNGQMQFHEVSRDEIARFSTGTFHIHEPAANSPTIDIQQIELCFVPLLAFDSSGHRLGLGKGFYDRALQGFTGLKVGIAFDQQECTETLPTDPHDQLLDLVITPTRVLRFKH